MNARWVSVLGPCLLGLSCAVGPDFKRPDAPSEKAYRPETNAATVVADGKSQHFIVGKAVAADWWRMLRSPALDAIVGQAIAGNPGLDAARSTLRSTQNNLRAGYGVFLPQGGVSLGASRQLSNPNPGTLPSSTYNLYTASGTVSYAVDIWGGGRRQMEVLAAAVDAQRATLAGAYVILTSNVVDAVIAQAAYRDEIEATQATLEILRQQVRIARAQATAGTVPYSTVLSLESQLASTEATLPQLEEKIDQTADLLAALSGKTPSGWHPPRVALADLKLPEDLPLTVPSLLVRQRPDVLVAEAQLHGANAAIGVATAAMLPNFTLGGGYGANATSAGSGPFWSLGAGLTQPIFQEGALNYERKAAIDTRDAAAALYRQTVLSAFQQVADTLRGLTHDAEGVAAEAEAVATAEKAVRLLQANYSAGVATYLQLLVADVQLLQARVGYVDAIARRLQDSVALYAALGGGWWGAPAAYQP